MSIKFFAYLVLPNACGCTDEKISSETGLPHNHSIRTPTKNYHTLTELKAIMTVVSSSLEDEKGDVFSNEKIVENLICN